MQPYHIIDYGRWARAASERQRCASMRCVRCWTPVRRWLGMDWPVAPLNPLLGVDAAVNRRTLDGKHPNPRTT